MYVPVPKMAKYDFGIILIFVLSHVDPVYASILESEEQAKSLYTTCKLPILQKFSAYNMPTPSTY